MLRWECPRPLIQGLLPLLHSTHSVIHYSKMERIDTLFAIFTDFHISAFEKMDESSTGLPREIIYIILAKYRLLHILTHTYPCTHTLYKAT